MRHRRREIRAEHQTVRLRAVQTGVVDLQPVDDDLVEGELQRPDGEFIDTQRRAKHSSLIKIRENFIPEMLKSAEDI